MYLVYYIYFFSPYGRRILYAFPQLPYVLDSIVGCRIYLYYIYKVPFFDGTTVGADAAWPFSL